MKRFVIRQNIEHYRAILTSRPILRSGVRIEQLLHDEEAKLKKYDDDNKKIARLQQDGLVNHALIAPAAWRMLAAMRRASSLVTRLGSFAYVMI